MTLRVHFFGEFRVWRGKVELTPQLTHLGKPKTLLKVLAAHPGRIFTSDELAEWLWPKMSADAAAVNVRKRVSELRQVLEPTLKRGTQSHYILSKREAGYTFNPQLACEMDTTQCKQRYEEAQRLMQAGQFSLAVRECEATLALMQGEFLAEDRYAEWALALRQEWDERFLDILDWLAESHARLGQYGAALSVCQRALQKNPTRENFYRRLMLYHYQKGDTGESLRVYQTCARMLHAQLEVEPSTETKELHQRILQRDIPSLPKAVPHNLPCPLTSFIGRERELAELHWLLPTTRLLTLTGIGGGGKTRLALQLATQVLPEYPDGVWWVEMAGLADAEFIPQAIATSIGIQEIYKNHLLNKLKETLHEKNLLLILDNCEHLAKGCARITEGLLTACPHLQIAVTSREALGLIGETVWVVPPLEIPNPAALPALKVLRQIESVSLFVERALASQPKFNLTKENAHCIAQICMQLDGIPLAIELAAARVRVLSVDQIAARLIERFDLLKERDPAALPRHQTLQATMDWSYQLISPQEQRLLQRLSVFTGGWSLEGAEAVCSDEATDSPDHAPSSLTLLTAQEIFHLLMSLVDKSLVIAETRDKEARYRLLETVRGYSQQKLVDANALALFQDRHLNFFVQKTEKSFEAQDNEHQISWFNFLEQEHDNIRAALAWSLQKKDTELALRLTKNIWRFWEVRGHVAEGLSWLKKVHQKSQHLRTELHARVLNGAANLANRQSNYAEARSFSEAALAIYRELNDQRGIATTLNNLGMIAGQQGDNAAARDFFEQALARFRAIDNKLGIAACLSNLGGLMIIQGYYELARVYHEEGLALRREIGNTAHIAISLNHLGNLAKEQDDYQQAHVYYEESLSLYRKVGDKTNLAFILHSLGSVALHEGDIEKANSYFTESFQMSQSCGERQRMADALMGLGAVQEAKENQQKAISSYQQGLILYREVQAKGGVVGALRALAGVLQSQKDWEQATSLYRESLQLLKALKQKTDTLRCLKGMAKIAFAQKKYGQSVTLISVIKAQAFSENDRETERYIKTLRSRLNEQIFMNACSKGCAMTLDQAIEYALALPSEKNRT